MEIGDIPVLFPKCVGVDPYALVMPNGLWWQQQHCSLHTYIGTVHKYGYCLKCSCHNFSQSALWKPVAQVLPSKNRNDHVSEIR